MFLSNFIFKPASFAFQIGPGESQPFELSEGRLEDALKKAQEQVNTWNALKTTTQNNKISTAKLSTV